MSKKISLLFVSLFLLIVFAGCGAQKNENLATQKIAGKVSIEIVGVEKEVIFSGDVSITNKMSVIDATRLAANKAGFPFDVENGYVRGINSIYEKDHGDMSGWLFKLNGEFSELGAGETYLSDGDSVLWFYSTDFSKDFSL